jgi:hypothetical protein
MGRGGTAATVASLMFVAAVILFVPAPYGGGAILPDPSTSDIVVLCVVLGLAVVPAALD